MITYTLVMTYVLVGMFLMGFSVFGVVWVFIIEPIVEWWRGKKS